MTDLDKFKAFFKEHGVRTSSKRVPVHYYGRIGGGGFAQEEKGEIGTAALGVNQAYFVFDDGRFVGTVGDEYPVWEEREA